MSSSPEDSDFQEKIKKETPEELLKRLENIVSPYEDKKRREDQVARETEESVKASGGFTLAMQPISGVAAGGAVGYGLDIVFNTSPLFLVILIPLGLAAGFVNLVRVLKEQDKEKEKEKNGSL